MIGRKSLKKIMKKNIFTLSAIAVAVAGIGLFSACSSEKKAGAESIAEEEVIAEEEIMPLSTPSNDSITGKLTASYFNDPANANAAENKVVTTPSGLKYVVVREGAGKQPAATSSVTVNYAGRLTDGTQFDSSYDRGEPATFPLNGVIAGWTEGLQTMKEGGKTVFYIPSNLAYGERGAGAAVPPNSDLIFVVELLNVQ